MKIEVRRRIVDGLASEALVVDGMSEVVVRPLSETPEDAIIGRGLVSCKRIAELMALAWRSGYNAAKPGFYHEYPDLEVSYTEVPPNEELEPW